MKRLFENIPLFVLLICGFVSKPVLAMEEEYVPEKTLQEIVLTEAVVPTLQELAIKPAVEVILKYIKKTKDISDTVMLLPVTSRVLLAYEIIKDKRYPGTALNKLALAYKASADVEYYQAQQLDRLFDEAIKNIDPCDFVNKKLATLLPGYQQKEFTLRDSRLIKAILHKSEMSILAKQIKNPFLTIKPVVMGFRGIISPDGTKVAFIVGFTTLCIWSIQRNMPVALFKVPNQLPFVHPALAWSPDSSLLALGLSDGSVHFFERNSFKDPKVLKVSGISPDFHLVDRENELQRIVFKEKVKKLSQEDKGFIAGLEGQAPQNILTQQNILQILTLAGPNKRPITWYLRQTTDVQIPIHFSTGEHEVEELAFSPDGNNLVTLSEDKTMRIWDIANITKRDEKALNSMEPIFDKEIKGQPIAIALSVQARRIVVAPSGQKLLVFDLHKEEPLITLDTNSHMEGYKDQSVNGIALSPDGKFLAYPYKKKVLLYDLENKKVMSVIKGMSTESGYIFSPGMSFKDDGPFMAFQDELNNKVDVYSMRFGNTLKAQIPHADYPSSFSANGQFLATWLTSLDIWELPTSFLTGNFTWEQLIEMLKNYCQKAKMKRLSR